MTSKAWVAILALAMPLAGCVDVPTPEDVPDEIGPLLAPPLEAALWKDPQLFPHPAYNWPTITHVPAHAPAWWKPIPARELPASVAGLEHLVSAGTGSTGDGIAVFGSLAVNPSGHVFDIRDPENPEVIATFQVEPSGRQAKFIPYPDGTLLAAFGTNGPSVPIWDLTDPEDPEFVMVLEVPTGSHSITVVPGTPILYNSNAVGSRAYPRTDSVKGATATQVEIFDLSDPKNPVLVQEWQNGYGCHMVSFHIDVPNDRHRAYCAAVDATQIWDIKDPKNPTIISTVPMPHGVDPAPGYPILAAVSHWAVVNPEATVMAVADEFGGGAIPGCDVHTDVGGQTVSGPMGNVYFYDISDEGNPELMSWINPGAHFAYNPDSVPGSCTAHIGRMIPQEGRNLLAMSFYAGGVGLIDFTDPSNPFFVDAWQERSPMDVWYYNGYLISGSNGIDVLALV